MFVLECVSGKNVDGAMEEYLAMGDKIALDRHKTSCTFSLFHEVILLHIFCPSLPLNVTSQNWSIFLNASEVNLSIFGFQCVMHTSFLDFRHHRKENSLNCQCGQCAHKTFL